MKNSSIVWLIIFLFSGIGSLANGLFMLIDPMTWFTELPAAVPDFGAYNEHFIRDLGCVFSVLGIAGLIATRWSSMRFPVAVLFALFHGSHSLLHIYDTARGYVGAEHWLIDLPLVHMPAVLFIVISLILKPSRNV